MVVTETHKKLLKKCLDIIILKNIDHRFLIDLIE